MSRALSTYTTNSASVGSNSIVLDASSAGVWYTHSQYTSVQYTYSQYTGVSVATGEAQQLATPILGARFSGHTAL